MAIYSEKRWAKGKSPHKFTYTYQDIADLTGLSVRTLWEYFHKGMFDPHSLSSTLSFISKYNQTFKK